MDIVPIWAPSPNQECEKQSLIKKTTGGNLIQSFFDHPDGLRARDVSSLERSTAIPKQGFDLPPTHKSALYLQS